MSFRELRNFTEMMRALNYPRLISIENFRNPNFKLVAEILAWLLKRYDPDYDLPMVLDSEQDRVIFIKTASLFLVQKARIKVNPKKLYQADGYAVQEMLKVAGVLYGSVQSSGADLDGDEDINVSSITANINAKVKCTGEVSGLAVVEDGGTASVSGPGGRDTGEGRLSLRPPQQGSPSQSRHLDHLHALDQTDIEEQRSTALARPLELKDVEKSLRASVKAVEEETRQTIANLNNVASDESSLDAKIEKKRNDLERQQKRLAQLQSVRPAYMDEYEKLESQLKALYEQYVHKFRNLAYLSQLQNEYDKAENERQMEAEISLRKMAEQMRDEERGRLAEAGRIDIDDQDLSPEHNPIAKAPRVYGNITGAGLSDEEEDEEDNSLLSEEDDEEVVVGATAGRAGEGRTMVGAEEEEGLSDFSDGDEQAQAFGGNIDQKPPPLGEDPLANSDDDF